MRVRHEQSIYLFLATAAMAAFVWFVADSIALAAICAVYVVAVGSFLGVDLGRMIKDTGSKPAGEFEPMRKWRYILALLVFAGIIGEAFALQQIRQAEMAAVYGSCGVGLMLVFGLLMAGLEANKLATGKATEANGGT